MTQQAIDHDDAPESRPPTDRALCRKRRVTRGHDDLLDKPVLSAAPAAPRDDVDEARWRTIATMARRGALEPRTTSAGRLFDAVASLCGLRATVTYEGQAVAELEACRDPSKRGTYPLVVRDDGIHGQQS